MPTVQYKNFELKSNETRIGSIVDTYKYLLPSWLRELKVVMFDESADIPEDAICWSKGLPEYGSCSINILTELLDKPEREQHIAILHEILHIAHRREFIFVWNRLLAPMQDKGEELYEYLVEDYRERNEEFIEGLAQAIMGGGVK